MIKILLVDDDNTNLKLLEDYISRFLLDNNIAYYIYKANNGKEALMIYKKKKLDLILTDMRMPICTGLEMICAIRENDLNIKIGLITAYRDLNVMEKLITEHINYYLIKPLTLDAVITMMEKVIIEKRQFHVILNNLVNLPENYIWNFDAQVLTCNEREINLTVKERIILSILLKNNNKVVVYDHLKEELWTNDPFSANRNSLKTLISTLRKKLPKNLIKNVYGLGYKIEL